MNIKDFIRRNNFDSYKRRLRKWNGYKVYHVWKTEWENAKIGYPFFALDDGKTIRLAEHEEVLSFMGFPNTHL